MATGLKVIVIEDNDDLREAMVDALRGQGHQVSGIDCAEAFSEASAWQRVDILVVDLNLPGEDGLSLVTRARAIQPDVGVIMVTARSQPEQKLAGYNAGADIYLTKPVSLQELSATIRSLGLRVQAHSIRQAGLQLEMTRNLLQYPGQSDIQLTGLECALITALVRAADQRLETWQLVEILGKGSAENPKLALEIGITRLRKKLENAKRDELHIRSIRGWGYQLQGRVQLL